MSELRFDGRVAVVTGAGAQGGMGREYALELARRGASVLINDIGISPSGEPLAAIVASEIQAAGGTAAFDTGNIGKESDARGLVRRAIKDFGTLDILINNAGNARLGDAAAVSTDDFMTVLNVNLMGSFWTMSEAIPHMRERGYGRIVNTTSANGAFGSFGNVGYVTAKSAIFGLTRSAALDNRDFDIKVNAVSPLAMTPLARPWFEALDGVDLSVLGAEKIAPPVLYLSHESCEPSGDVFSAGAGRVARIFVATAPGYWDSELTPESVASNLETVLDPSGFIIPGQTMDQYPLFRITKDGADRVTQVKEMVFD